jgi:hypothetical protein
MPARSSRCGRDFVGERKGVPIRGDTHATAKRRENNPVAGRESRGEL